MAGTYRYSKCANTNITKQQDFDGLAIVVFILLGSDTVWIEIHSKLSFKLIKSGTVSYFCDSEKLIKTSYPDKMFSKPGSRLQKM